MKTFRWLFLLAVASLGMGGCCVIPRPDTVMRPAVLISPPECPTGQGKGILAVTVTPRCIPRDWIPTAKYTLYDGKKKTNYLIGIPVPLKPGHYTLTYQKLANHVKPPATPVEILAGGTTKVKITYNLQGVSVTGGGDGKQVANGPRGHHKHRGYSALATISPGVIVTEPALKPTGTGNGYLTVKWADSQSTLHPKYSLWWVNAASKRTINTISGVMASGNMTVTFGPLAGYTAPNPTLVHVWQGQTTTMTVTYGQP